MDGAPRYLPEGLADWLRRASAGIADTTTRGELVRVAEAAYHEGHGAGYDRGYRDGADERDAQYRAVLTPPAGSPYSYAGSAPEWDGPLPDVGQVPATAMLGQGGQQ